MMRKRKYLSKAARHHVLNVYGYKCRRCGSRANLEVHHKRRIADGGRDEISNLEILCRGCHIHHHKADKTPGRDAWENLVAQYA